MCEGARTEAPRPRQRAAAPVNRARQSALTAGAIASAALAVQCVGLTAAAAQEVQVTGPLAGAPAVKGLRQYRRHRLQLKPTAGFSLQDPFSRNLMLGAQAQYHIFDWLGVGVWGGYTVVHFDTDLTRDIESDGQTTETNALSLPSKDYFGDQIGRMNWVVSGQVTFIPLRGKLALFQKVFVDSDFYLFGGVAAVGIEERSDVTDAQVCASVPEPGATPSSDACVATQTARSSRVAIAPTFGVGLSVYTNRFLGISLEWRGLPFRWNQMGTDEAGDNGFPDGQIDSSDQRWEFTHMVNLGVSFFLPTALSYAK